ncbi:MAG: putative methyltransferase [Candidatus Saccharibacteria bacterium]|nr:putative methyltransferase [Candidatus Saccharibacteria bacterium]
MPQKSLPIVTVTLDKIVGGGQALATMDDGRKIFVWGGLPGEQVEVQLTKRKSKLAEGVVINVLTVSDERIKPTDADSYMSTSPWQIMSFDAEQRYKSALIEEAFELHDIVLPDPIAMYSDERIFEYRNKIEYSFWWDNERDQLDLAFFRRGTHGKIAIEKTSLASTEITAASQRLLELLRNKQVNGFSLKTLLVRSARSGAVSMQLYVKDKDAIIFDANDFTRLDVQGFEIIYSNPKSPASVITERLVAFGSTTLIDTILDISYRYSTESFFQINLPVYEQALHDMKEWVQADKPTVDLYSGVGTIGLSIGSSPLTLVEINESAVDEMKANISELERSDSATAILAASENALDYIDNESLIIVDPPRAGLHDDVIAKLLDEKPERIIYLSCNPVTQARDVMKLADTYGIRWHRGYNFFPRTPHIEHLVILDKKA